MWRATALRGIAPTAVVIVLLACVPDVTGPKVVGGCGLDVYLDTNQELVPLQPPYVVELSPTAGTFISLSGSGWQRPGITLLDPDHRLADDFHNRADYLNGGHVGFAVDAPGTWTFQLTDPVAVCERAFSVEVLPATGP